MIICDITMFRLGRSRVRGFKILSILGGFLRQRFQFITIAECFESARCFANMDINAAALYEEAVYALNGLQSNAAVIQKARAERDANAHKNLTETVRHLQTLGVELSDLDKLNIIHVAGTKGKGSTCAFTESILRRHGIKTGFYSSPHLVSVNERIRIAGSPIDKKHFASYFWEVYNPLQQSLKDGERMPPYFMFLTVMAFYIFIKEQIQAAVIEVGIGGLYDCTNVIKKPVVIAVSSLGIDHVNLLGQTLPEIAVHKAGIFKPGVPVLTVSQHKTAMKVLCDKAKEVDCPLILAPPLEVYEQNFKLNVPSVVQNTNASLALQISSMWLNSVSCKNLIIPLKYTLNDNCDNDQVYLPMAPTFPIDDKFKEGLDSCIWPGRFQTIKKDGFTIYLDGAHTIQSMKYCSKWFQDASMKERNTIKHSVLRVLLFNCTGERKAENLLDPLSDLDFDLVVFSPNRKSVMKDSSSDQSNFMIDPEQEMKQCKINKEIWCHLMRSLSENEQSMATSHYAAVVYNTKVSSISKEDNIITFCCLGNAVNWLLYQKNVTHCSLCDKSISFTDLLQNVGHVQVLVTGSLHLVGGVLALIGSDV